MQSWRGTGACTHGKHAENEPKIRTKEPSGKAFSSWKSARVHLDRKGCSLEEPYNLPRGLHRLAPLASKHHKQLQKMRRREPTMMTIKTDQGQGLSFDGRI